MGADAAIADSPSLRASTEAAQPGADVPPRNAAGVRRICERVSRGGEVKLVVERLEELKILRRNDRGEVPATSDEAKALMAVRHAIDELSEILARLADADRFGHVALQLYNSYGQYTSARSPVNPQGDGWSGRR